MRFPKEEGILLQNCNMEILPECLTFGLKTVTSTPEIFRLLACLVDFGMCQTPQLHKPIPEQNTVFLSSSLSYHLYMYKLYNPIVCFSGDP